MTHTPAAEKPPSLKVTRKVRNLLVDLGLSEHPIGDEVEALERRVAELTEQNKEQSREYEVSLTMANDATHREHAEKVEAEARLRQAQSLPEKWRESVEKWSHAKSRHQLLMGISEVSKCADELESALGGGEQSSSEGKED